MWIKNIFFMWFESINSIILLPIVYFLFQKTKLNICESVRYIRGSHDHVIYFCGLQIIIIISPSS